MKTENYIKEQFMKIIKHLEYADNPNELIIWDEIIEKYSNFTGGEILISKSQNLLKLLNETKLKSEQEFEILLDRDIQTDLWFII